MWETLQIIFWTFVPTLELRASIPYGIFKLGMNWVHVFIIALISNVILGILVFHLLEWIMKMISKIKFIDKYWSMYVNKTQKKIHKGVEKYGEWAIAVFIGIPLPGSGVYTGALAAFLIGLSKKKFYIANFVGVIIAAILVTLFCIVFTEISDHFIKTI